MTWEIYRTYPEHPYVSPERDEASFKELLARGKERIVSRHYMERTAEGLLPGAIILLWRINFETFTTQSVFPKYLEYTYGISGSDVLQELLAENYISLQTGREALSHLSMKELKYLLQQQQLSGYSKMKRDELEQFASSKLTEDYLETAVSIRGYRLTPKGQQVLNANQDIVDKHPKKQY